MHVRTLSNNVDGDVRLPERPRRLDYPMLIIHCEISATAVSFDVDMREKANKDRQHHGGPDERNAAHRKRKRR